MGNRTRGPAGAGRRRGWRVRPGSLQGGVSRREPCSAGLGTGRCPWGTLTVSSSRASASWARRKAACSRSPAACRRKLVSGRRHCAARGTGRRPQARTRCPRSRRSCARTPRGGAEGAAVRRGAGTGRGLPAPSGPVQGCGAPAAGLLPSSEARPASFLLRSYQRCLLGCGHTEENNLLTAPRRNRNSR